MKSILQLCFALALVATVAPGSQASTCTLIQGAHVLLPEGAPQQVDVVFRAGQIISVGEDNGEGSGCVIIKAHGKILTPGLIETQTALGLVEISLEPSTNDTQLEAPEVGPQNRAAFQVWEGYNPDSTLIPIARRGGITSALLVPRGGTISGQIAWADLQGTSQAEAIQGKTVALVTHLGQAEASRAAGLHRLRGLLEESRTLQACESEWKKGRTRTFANVRGLRALWPLLAGEIPLVIHTHRATDIERALALSKSFGIRIIIAGGAEAWRLKEALARAKVAVIVDAESNGPGSFDQLHGRADNAAILEKAGVQVILSTFSTHNARKLSQMAGNAVREGMSHAGALRAISQNAAAAFGLQGLGVIRPGARANLVLWSGDPLELAHSPIALWIQGVPQDLTTRQTRLRDRYLNRTPATGTSAQGSTL